MFAPDFSPIAILRTRVIGTIRQPFMLYGMMNAAPNWEFFLRFRQVGMLQHAVQGPG